MDTFIENLRDRDIVRYMLLRSVKDPAQRKDIATLLEFDSEISRIPFIINDTMMGYIRTAWWRDNLLAGKVNIAYTENNLLNRTQGLLYYNRNKEYIAKAFEDLINSIELIIEKKKFNDAEEFLEAYIKPVGAAYANLICNILNIPTNEKIEALFRAYAIIAFIRSYDLLVDFGWELFNLPHNKLVFLLNSAKDNLKNYDKKLLKYKPFKILYTSANFFTEYYLKNVPSREASQFEPNLGLLRIKLAWQILF
ncbi:MAG: hypothetical protein K0R02_884 [Rickettsiaceae bacterium]|jgi:hypothetical protein|nr:hypothetical protein [Rickettsiaceae bacterium]